MYQEKSQTRDELLRHVVDGAALIRNNHERIRKATLNCFKTISLVISNAEGSFEEQAI
jgi:hypothetical protein